MCLFAVVMLLLLSLPKSGQAQDKSPGLQLDAIPPGYSLYAYDDCGIAERQPHVDMTDAYMWTFNTSDTDADLKSRSAVFSYKQLRFNFNDLDPKRDYVLALTYASDHVYKRVQSLWADGIELHGPMPLPHAKAIRTIVKMPSEVTQDGKMALVIKIHGEVNATASIVELWATGEPVDPVRFHAVAGVPGGLAGRLVDLAYGGIRDARVRLLAQDDRKLLGEAVTDDEGSFSFEDRLWSKSRAGSDLLLTTSVQDKEISMQVKLSDVSLEPIRYRPLPSKVGGLKKHEISIDGTWKLNVSPGPTFLQEPLTGKEWADFTVPGQWKQQGFEIPQDKAVAMAREFTIPKKWEGYRIILRFDAIHAGTNYWLNGKKLGYSENLFTPVEWDITDQAMPGKKNRLDLEMKVETVSEKLSYSSGYAFHSLGGIDRSVRLFALPRVNIRDLRILTDLDSLYKNAEIKLSATIENSSDQETVNDVAMHLSLVGPDGKPALISTQKLAAGPVKKGPNEVKASIAVSDPLKWTAETPSLYRFALELKQGENVLQRIERSIGFRKIEIRGSLLYVNGKVVKFAGACHHEHDPLTGRADTAKHAEEDVKLARDINLNYLRTAHYPPTEEFLDACDRLGMYVECEAPFCWVPATDDLYDLPKVMAPTSAMIDCCHTHPSIVVWSVANESPFNRYFEYSNKVIKELDPTRPTTFNNPDPKRICDISNVHYPLMPYDEVMKEDPRPMFLGEYWFPVCHEQTDVMINPGLRELWGHGHADPDSEFGKLCAKSFEPRLLMPGTDPGAWTHIYKSKRVIGGAIWALIDEPFYFKDGTHCGYAWVHGFWGLYDGWRRPKPEAWLAKMIFSPVWFPERELDFRPGQESVTVPVENRYSFTDFDDLRFSYGINGGKRAIKVHLPPGRTGAITLPVPQGTKEGDRLTIRVTRGDALVTVYDVTLGKKQQAAVPRPAGGAPDWTDDRKAILIEGNGYSLAIDRRTGQIDASNPKHKTAIKSYPALHVTRHDYGDLNGPKSPPYAVFPDAKTRVVEDISVSEKGNALEIRIKDRYDGFSGSVTWLIDRDGLSTVTSDYTYSGEEMDYREVGVAMMIRPECDELKWKRWSEWGDVFPKDSISRTTGAAKARRSKNLPDVPEITPPTWTWALDQTEMGTNDFRSAKFNIYNASLVAPDGSGVEALSDAKAHVRACLVPEGVKMHVLSECPLGPFKLKAGDRITGEFTLRLLGGRR